MSWKERGVTVNGKHTFKDWGLVWTGCKIASPEPITKYVQVPGRKTLLDCTSSIYDTVTYKNRKITLDFAAQNTPQQWQQKFSQIANKVHGQLCKVALDTDPECYWMGRATVSASKTEKSLNTFTITIDAEPFKYFSEEPSDEWLWDPFNFQNGIIQNLRNRPVSGTTTITVKASSRPLTPVVTATADMTLSIPSVGNQPATNWTLTANEPKKLNGVLLYNATYSFRFTGTGNVSITFRGESL